MKKKAHGIQEYRKYNKDWPKGYSKSRQRLHWSSLLFQKLERLLIPELTQGSGAVKPGTLLARKITILMGQVPVTADLKDFERQIGEDLSKRALSLDQDFFRDFTEALNCKSEERSSWRALIYDFLIKHSEEADLKKTEEEIYEWLTNRPEFVKLTIPKGNFCALLKEVKFKETRGKF